MIDLSQRTYVLKWALLLLSVIAAFYATPLLVQGGVKYVIAFLVALPLLVVMFSLRKATLVVGLYISFITFIFGQRTFHIGDFVRIVPSEAIGWLLFFLLLFYNNRKGVRVGTHMPLSAKLFAVLILLGIISAYARLENYQAGLQLAKSVVFFIPAFYVIFGLVDDFDHVRRLVALVSALAAILAFLGISEYLQLGFVKLLPGYFTAVGGVSGSEGFDRALGSFWGTGLLSAFIVLVFPLTLAHFRLTRNPFTKGIMIIGLVLSALYIYVAGYRGVWLGFLVALLSYAYFKGARAIFLLLVAVMVGLQFLPEEFFKRVELLYIGAQGQQVVSVSSRELRLQYAVQIIRANPFLGGGWGASGLVHNDFLQVAADCGIAAMVSWLLFYWWAVKQLAKSIRSSNSLNQKEYDIGFLSAMSGFFIVLLTEAMLHYPEYYIPFWFLFALAARAADLTMESNHKTATLEESKNVRSWPQSRT